MTREEFARRELEPCRECGSPVTLETDPTNDKRIQIICANSLCLRRRSPWGSVEFLKVSDVRRRKEYPPGNSLDEVWARFGDVCFLCGVLRTECEILGIGRERHHVLEYVKTGHEGPIVPICGQCHPIATNQQRLRAFLRRTIQSLSNPDPDGQPVPRRRAGVSASRLPPHSVRASGEAPAGALEGLSDDDADA